MMRRYYVQIISGECSMPPVHFEAETDIHAVTQGSRLAMNLVGDKYKTQRYTVYNAITKQKVSLQFPYSADLGSWERGTTVSFFAQNASEAVDMAAEALNKIRNDKKYKFDEDACVVQITNNETNNYVFDFFNGLVSPF